MKTGAGPLLGDSGTASDASSALRDPGVENPAKSSVRSNDPVKMARARPRMISRLNKATKTIDSNAMYQQSGLTRDFTYSVGPFIKASTRSSIENIGRPFQESSQYGCRILGCH
jgi:hypothetical protein